MTDRLEEIRDVLATSPDDLRLSRELLAELDAAEARLAACEQERDEARRLSLLAQERLMGSLARAEEALRQIKTITAKDTNSIADSDRMSAFRKVRRIARAYFAGEK